MTMMISIILLLITNFIATSNQQATETAHQGGDVQPSIFYDAGEPIFTAKQFDRNIFLITQRRLLKLEENTANTQERNLNHSVQTNLAFVTVGSDRNNVISCQQSADDYLRCSATSIEDLNTIAEAVLMEPSEANQINSLIGVGASLKNGYPALYVASGIDGEDEFSPSAISLRSAKTEQSFLITKPSMNLYYRKASDSKVEFIEALNYNGFTYFFGSKLRNGVSSAFIARVCSNDTDFRSYVETNVECKQSLNRFTFIYSNFIDSTNSGYQIFAAMTNDQASAVCSIDWNALNDHLDATVRHCVVDGKGNFGLDHFRRYGDSFTKRGTNNRCTKVRRIVFFLILIFLQFLPTLYVR